MLKPGMHASTFGGNPIACRAGLAAIETIEQDGPARHAAERSASGSAATSRRSATSVPT